MSGLVRHERRHGLAVLTLDSPANRNALSLRLLAELLDGLAGAREDDSRGVLLDHTGSVFCAGVDLRERRLHADDPGAHSRLLAELLVALWEHPKPVLCRVGGASRGGGMGLVACSDIVVADAAATFAYSEVRVGVAPALVCALALQKVPLGALLPLLLTGEAFDAPTAQRLGLVTTIGTAETVDACAAAIAAGGPEAVRTTKRLAREAAGVADIHAVVARMEEISAALFAGTEAAEGMAAFAEKRPPAWAASV